MGESFAFLEKMVDALVDAVQGLDLLKEVARPPELRLQAREEFLWEKRDVLLSLHVLLKNVMGSLWN